MDAGLALGARRNLRCIDEISISPVGLYRVSTRACARKLTTDAVTTLENVIGCELQIMTRVTERSARGLLENNNLHSLLGANEAWGSFPSSFFRK